MKQNKNFKHYILFFIIIFLVLEGVSFFAYKFYLNKKLYFITNDYESFINSQSDEFIKSFKEKTYNNLFGWDNPRNFRNENVNSSDNIWKFTTDNIGRRLTPYESKFNFISTYGDSFTFYDEVKDNQTWQYYLSKLSDSRVSNFEVGGYGLDQSLLKLEYNLKNKIDKPKIVVLTVFSNDIDRIVTLYRLFFKYDRPVIGFKPMFYKEKDKYMFIKNPLQSVNSKENFLQAYELVKNYDYWYRIHKKRYQVRFPYTFSLLKIARGLITGDAIFNPDDINLYKDKKNTDKMTFILERFVSLSNKYHFKPVILFIPAIDDVKNFKINKDYKYRSYISKLKNNKAFEKAYIVNVIDSKAFIKADPYTKSKPPHLSKKGNWRAAKILYKEIKPEIDKIKKELK